MSDPTHQVAKLMQGALEPVRFDEMTVKPTCRYGHGEMNPVMNEISQAVGGFGALRFSLVKDDPKPYQDGGVFTFALYRCKTCRYMEIFDLEAD